MNLSQVTEQSLDAIWQLLGTAASTHAISLRIGGAADEDAASRDLVFIVEGRMPPDGPHTRYYGWYVRSGRARVWSAYGHEHPRDIVAGGRWVLGGLNYRPRNRFSGSAAAG